MREYSVLMSVYHREKAAYLRQSMESMFAQTVPPSDFVLVCDGSLPDSLEEVIREMQQEHGGVLQIIRLAVNGGLGRALKKGISFCRFPVIARMDSDDISRPDRCERQLAILENRQDIDIVSGTIEEFREFDEENTAVCGRRILPSEPEAVRRYARLRCPFNHPCVMFRKQAVLDAGNYSEEEYPEDYYLWVRMLQRGSRGYNIREPLLWMRAEADLYRRRAGDEYLRKHLHLFRYMYDTGFISAPQYAACSAIRTMSAVMPNRLRAAVYSRLLHRRQKAGKK